MYNACYEGIKRFIILSTFQHLLNLFMVIYEDVYIIYSIIYLMNSSINAIMFTDAGTSVVH